MSSKSDFIDRVPPLRERLRYYDRTNPPSDQPANAAADPAKNVPQSFIDCMTVREEVYVQEQKVPLENELDEDDERSFHWVAYASIGSHAAPENGSSGRKSSTSTKIPIGTIRLVPPPHPPHPQPGSHHKADALDVNPGQEKTNVHDGKEPYIKLGRLAVIKEFRKAGISRLLIETALQYARDHPYDMVPQYDPSKVEAARQDASNGGVGMEWRGLVMLHAQVGVQKVWKRYGFETDESMGIWDEEGIDHVGMWRRLEVSDQRRKSKARLVGSPLGSP